MRAPRRPILATLFALALSASLAWAEDRPATLEVGKLAPKLSVSQWRNTSDKTPTLDDLAGKVVVLDFWDVSDDTCKVSLPKVVKLHKDLAEKGVVVVAVQAKPAGNDLADLAAIVDKEKLEFPLCVDEQGDTAKAFKVRGVPSYVVIDKKGVVRSSSHSAPATADLEKLLAE